MADNPIPAEYFFIKYLSSKNVKVFCYESGLGLSLANDRIQSQNILYFQYDKEVSKFFKSSNVILDANKRIEFYNRIAKAVQLKEMIQYIL